MEVRIRRKREIGFDKRFDLVDGNSELCHHTGYEVVFDDEEDVAENIWMEYLDSSGNYHYGR